MGNYGWEILNVENIMSLNKKTHSENKIVRAKSMDKNSRVDIFNSRIFFFTESV